MQPLPAPVPLGQTVEGGVQMRITPAGFNKLTSIIPGVLADALGGGFCISGTVDLGVAEVCYENACTGGARGCQVNVVIDSINMSVPDSQTFRVAVQFDASSRVDVRVPIPVLPDITCDIDASLTNGQITADLAFGIDPATGELTVELTQLQAFDLSNISLSGCGGVGDILGALLSGVFELLSTDIGLLVVNLLAPVINDLVQGFLPDPLGLEGLLPLGDMIGLGAPDDAALETRAVAGGYVSLPANGLSVGMIVGLNADRDPATRAPENQSEPNACVPPRAAPTLTLPMTSRGSFALMPAGAFLGTPDPPNDLILGISETVLDVAGHHIVSSGTMCLGVGSDLVPQLNVGTIGIIVPSLSDLGETGREPLLLVLRPQQPLDFTVGEGTMTSPNLTIHLNELEVDFYAFLMERYVRGFTVTLDLDVGVNMEFALDDMGNPAIMPTLVGLDSSAIGVTVHNAEILEEDPAQLEAVFPTLFDLVLPLLGDGFGVLTLPDLGGFTLSNLTAGKVSTSEDEFLAIYADLSPTMKTMRLVERSKPFSAAARSMKPMPSFTPVETSARVVRVTTPPAAEIRAALEGRAGRLPEVELDLAGVGRGLEWQWRLDGGMWRPFSSDHHPVLRDRAFAVQGRHELEVRARQQDDFRTLDRSAVTLPIVIDSVPPRIRPEVTFDGGDVVFTAVDLVSEDAQLEWAFTADLDGTPHWVKSGGHLPLDAARTLAAISGTLFVHVRDELGNGATTSFDGTVVGFHGRLPDDGGCNCYVGAAGHDHDGGAAAGLLGALAIAFLGVATRVARRFRKKLPWVLLFVVAAANPGCSCGEDAGPECVLHEDCECPAGQVASCLDGACACEEEVAYGDIGKWSDLGVGTTTAGAVWVSAYNRTYGDLMVARVEQAGRVPDEAWEFVDGVPEGPVEVERGTVRGGVLAEGDDVGQHTSIAVNAQGEPMVSYYDADGASLKFAARWGGAWSHHQVDAGSAISDPELGGAEVGKYTSITLDGQGRPGIAYYATFYDTGGLGRSEVRFARARTAQPAGASDWDFFTVDMVALPPVPGGEDPPVIPEGVGLFLSAARRLDGSPVLAYYDRPNGDLKLVTFDTASDTFAAPQVVDGADGSDVGWYPSVAVDPGDQIHLSYVDAGRDNLIYCNLTDRLPAIVDDGYRVDGQTSDGLPMPVFHFVGDDSGIIANGALLAIAYQDATSHELLLSHWDAVDMAWKIEPIAGSEDPFTGAYGFYASAELDVDDVVISTYVIDPKNHDAWVEVFRVRITEG